MSTDLNQYYLQQMGVQVWIERPVNSVLIKLSELERRVSSCVDCGWHQNPVKSVFGRGNTSAKLMIIGDAPGVADEQEGKPFAGRTGAFLNRMLSSIGLAEENAYMTNALKFRSNIDGQKEESNICHRHLGEQIALITPDIIVMLGSLAGQLILKTGESLKTLRGQPYHYGEIPCVVSFHPNHLLQNPRDKKEAYNDWLIVKKMLSAK